MPHTRSAKKNLRKNLKRRQHNRALLRDIKTQIKQFQSVAQGGSLEDARKQIRIAFKKLDKAAARRIIHPNMAARKKSQLARALHARESAGKAPAK
jgi:small subunit ribosomal protein S20